MGMIDENTYAVLSNTKDAVYMDQEGVELDNLKIRVFRAPSATIVVGDSKSMEAVNVTVEAWAANASAKNIAVGAAIVNTKEEDISKEYGAGNVLNLDGVKATNVFGGGITASKNYSLYWNSYYWNNYRYENPYTTVTVGDKENYEGVTATTINVNDAQVTTLFGAGGGVGSYTYGDSVINFNGGKVTTLFGGAGKGGVMVGDVYITVSENATGKISNIYAGGDNTMVEGSATVTFNTNYTNFSGTVYGTGKGTAATVTEGSTLVFDGYNGEFRGTIKNFSSVVLTGDTTAVFTKAQDKSMASNAAYYEFVVDEDSLYGNAPMLTWNKKASFSNIAITIEDEALLTSDESYSVTLISSSYFKSDSVFDFKSIKINGATAGTVMVNGEIVKGGEYSSNGYVLEYDWNKKTGGTLKLTYTGSKFSFDSPIDEDITLSDADQQVILEDGAELKKKLDLGDGDNTLDIQKGAVVTGNILAGDGNDTVTLAKGAEVAGNIDLGAGENSINVGSQADITGSIILAEGSDNTITVASAGAVESIRDEGCNSAVISLNGDITGGGYGRWYTAAAFQEVLDGAADKITRMTLQEWLDAQQYRFEGDIFIPANLDLSNATGDIKVLVNRFASVGSIYLGSGNDYVEIANDSYFGKKYVSFGNSAFDSNDAANVVRASVDLGSGLNTIVLKGGDSLVTPGNPVVVDYYVKSSADATNVAVIQDGAISIDGDKFLTGSANNAIVIASGVEATFTGTKANIAAFQDHYGLFLSKNAILNLGNNSYIVDFKGSLIAPAKNIVIMPQTAEAEGEAADVINQYYTAGDGVEQSFIDALTVSVSKDAEVVSTVLNSTSGVNVYGTLTDVKIGGTGLVTFFAGSELSGAESQVAAPVLIRDKAIVKDALINGTALNLEKGGLLENAIINMDADITLAGELIGVTIEKAGNVLLSGESDSATSIESANVVTIANAKAQLSNITDATDVVFTKNYTNEGLAIALKEDAALSTINKDVTVGTIVIGENEFDADAITLADGHVFTAAAEKYQILDSFVGDFAAKDGFTVELRTLDSDNPALNYYGINGAAAFNGNTVIVNAGNHIIAPVYGDITGSADFIFKSGNAFFDYAQVKDADLTYTVRQGAGLAFDGIISDEERAVLIDTVALDTNAFFGIGSQAVIKDWRGPLNLATDIPSFGVFQGLQQFEELYVNKNGQVTGYITGTNGMDTVTLGENAVVNGSRARYDFGSISLKAGDDTLTMEKGSVVNGAIDMGAGDDTLVLLGATINKAVNQAKTTVTLNGGSVHVIEGENTINGDIELGKGGGVLNIAEGAKLTVNDILTTNTNGDVAANLEGELNLGASALALETAAGEATIDIYSTAKLSDNVEELSASGASATITLHEGTAAAQLLNAEATAGNAGVILEEGAAATGDIDISATNLAGLTVAKDASVTAGYVELAGDAMTRLDNLGEITATETVMNGTSNELDNFGTFNGDIYMLNDSETTADLDAATSNLIENHGTMTSGMISMTGVRNTITTDARRNQPAGTLEVGVLSMHGTATARFVIGPDLHDENAYIATPAVSNTINGTVAVTGDATRAADDLLHNDAALYMKANRNDINVGAANAADTLTVNGMTMLSATDSNNVGGIQVFNGDVIAEAGKSNLFGSYLKDADGNNIGATQTKVTGNATLTTNGTGTNANVILNADVSGDLTMQANNLGNNTLGVMNGVDIITVAKVGGNLAMTAQNNSNIVTEAEARAITMTAGQNNTAVELTATEGDIALTADAGTNTADALKAAAGAITLGAGTNNSIDTAEANAITMTAGQNNTAVELTATEGDIALTANAGTNTADALKAAAGAITLDAGTNNSIDTAEANAVTLTAGGANAVSAVTTKGGDLTVTGANNNIFKAEVAGNAAITATNNNVIGGTNDATGEVGALTATGDVTVTASANNTIAAITANAVTLTAGGANAVSAVTTKGGDLTVTGANNNIFKAEVAGNASITATNNNVIGGKDNATGEVGALTAAGNAAMNAGNENRIEADVDVTGNMTLTAASRNVIDLLGRNTVKAASITMNGANNDNNDINDSNAVIVNRSSAPESPENVASAEASAVSSTIEAAGGITMLGSANAIRLFTDASANGEYRPGLHDHAEITLGSVSRTISGDISMIGNGANTIAAGYQLAANGEGQIAAGDMATTLDSSITMQGAANNLDLSIQATADTQAAIEAGAMTVTLNGDVTMATNDIENETNAFSADVTVSDNSNLATTNPNYSKVTLAAAPAIAITGDITMEGLGAVNTVTIGNGVSLEGDITMGSTDKDKFSKSNTLNFNLGSSEKVGTVTMLASERNTMLLEGEGQLAEQFTAYAARNVIVVGEDAVLGSAEKNVNIDMENYFDNDGDGVDQGDEQITNTANTVAVLGTVNGNINMADKQLDGDFLQSNDTVVVGSVMNADGSYVTPAKAATLVMADADQHVAEAVVTGTISTGDTQPDDTDSVYVIKSKVGGDITMGLRGEAEANASNSNLLQAYGAELQNVTMTAGKANTAFIGEFTDARDAAAIVTTGSTAGAIDMLAGTNNALAMKNVEAGAVTMDAGNNNTLTAETAIIDGALDMDAVNSNTATVTDADINGAFSMDAVKSNTATLNYVDVLGDMTMTAVEERNNLNATEVAFMGGVAMDALRSNTATLNDVDITGDMTMTSAESYNTLTATVATIGGALSMDAGASNTANLTEVTAGTVDMAAGTDNTLTAKTSTIGGALDMDAANSNTATLTNVDITGNVTATADTDSNTITMTDVTAGTVDMTAGTDNTLTLKDSTIGALTMDAETGANTATLDADPVTIDGAVTMTAAAGNTLQTINYDAAIILDADDSNKEIGVERSAINGAIEQTADSGDSSNQIALYLTDIAGGITQKGAVNPETLEESIIWGNYITVQGHALEDKSTTYITAVEGVTVDGAISQTAALYNSTTLEHTDVNGGVTQTSVAYNCLVANTNTVPWTDTADETVTLKTIDGNIEQTLTAEGTGEYNLNWVQLMYVNAGDIVQKAEYAISSGNDTNHIDIDGAILNGVRGGFNYDVDVKHVTIGAMEQTAVGNNYIEIDDADVKGITQTSSESYNKLQVWGFRINAQAEELDADGQVIHAAIAGRVAASQIDGSVVQDAADYNKMDLQEANVTGNLKQSTEGGYNDIYFNNEFGRSSYLDENGYTVYVNGTIGGGIEQINNAENYAVNDQANNLEAEKVEITASVAQTAVSGANSIEIRGVKMEATDSAPETALFSSIGGDVTQTATAGMNYANLDMVNVDGGIEQTADVAEMTNANSLNVQGAELENEASQIVDIANSVIGKGIEQTATAGGNEAQIYSASVAGDVTQDAAKRNILYLNGGVTALINATAEEEGIASKVVISEIQGKVSQTSAMAQNSVSVTKANVLGGIEQTATGDGDAVNNRIVVNGGTEQTSVWNAEPVLKDADAGAHIVTTNVVKAQIGGITQNLVGNGAAENKNTVTIKDADINGDITQTAASGSNDMFINRNHASSTGISDLELVTVTRDGATVTNNLDELKDTYGREQVVNSTVSGDITLTVGDGMNNSIYIESTDVEGAISETAGIGGSNNMVLQGSYSAGMLLKGDNLKPEKKLDFQESLTDEQLLYWGTAQAEAMEVNSKITQKQNGSYSESKDSFNYNYNTLTLAEVVNINGGVEQDSFGGNTINAAVLPVFEYDVNGLTKSVDATSTITGDVSQIGMSQNRISITNSTKAGSDFRGTMVIDDGSITQDFQFAGQSIDGNAEWGIELAKGNNEAEIKADFDAKLAQVKAISNNIANVVGVTGGATLSMDQEQGITQGSDVTEVTLKSKDLPALNDNFFIANGIVYEKKVDAVTGKVVYEYAADGAVPAVKDIAQGTALVFTNTNTIDVKGRLFTGDVSQAGKTNAITVDNSAQVPETPIAAFTASSVAQFGNKNSFQANTDNADIIIGTYDNYALSETLDGIYRLRNVENFQGGAIVQKGLRTDDLGIESGLAASTNTITSSSNGLFMSGDITQEADAKRTLEYVDGAWSAKGDMSSHQNNLAISGYEDAAQFSSDYAASTGRKVVGDTVVGTVAGEEKVVAVNKKLSKSVTGSISQTLVDGGVNNIELQSVDVKGGISQSAYVVATGMKDGAEVAVDDALMINTASNELTITGATSDGEYVEDELGNPMPFETQIVVSTVAGDVNQYNQNGNNDITAGNSSFEADVMQETATGNNDLWMDMAEVNGDISQIVDKAGNNVVMGIDFNNDPAVYSEVNILGKNGISQSTAKGDNIVEFEKLVASGAISQTVDEGNNTITLTATSTVSGIISQTVGKGTNLINTTAQTYVTVEDAISQTADEGYNTMTLKNAVVEGAISQTVVDGYNVMTLTDSKIMADITMKTTYPGGHLEPKDVTYVESGRPGTNELEISGSSIGTADNYITITMVGDWGKVDQDVWKFANRLRINNNSTVYANLKCESFAEGIASQAMAVKVDAGSSFYAETVTMSRANDTFGTTTGGIVSVKTVNMGGGSDQLYSIQAEKLIVAADASTATDDIVSLFGANDIDEVILSGGADLRFDGTANTVDKITVNIDGTAADDTEIKNVDLSFAGTNVYLGTTQLGSLNFDSLGNTWNDGSNVVAGFSGSTLTVYKQPQPLV